MTSLMKGKIIKTSSPTSTSKSSKETSQPTITKRTQVEAVVIITPGSIQTATATATASESKRRSDDNNNNLNLDNNCNKNYKRNLIK